MLQTADIYLGALALVRGGQLRGVAIEGVNGRRLAVFRIEGKHVEEAESQYFGGSATVNVQLLKFQVRRLKDRAFEALREEAKRGGGNAIGDAWRDTAASGGEPHRRGGR